MMLVTLDQARSHMKIDTMDGDADLLLKIEAASDLVVEYLKHPSFADSNGDLPEDSNGIVIDVPNKVKMATLVMIGYLLRQPDNDAGKEYESGALPRPVTAMLYGERIPTIGASRHRRHRHHHWEED